MKQATPPAGFTQDVAEQEVAKLATAAGPGSVLIVKYPQSFDEAASLFWTACSKLADYLKLEKERIFYAPPVSNQGDSRWKVSWPGHPDTRNNFVDSKDVMKSFDTWREFNFGSFESWEKELTVAKSGLNINVTKGLGIGY